MARNFVLPRNRYIIVTACAGTLAAISAIFVVGAPPIPSAIGVTLAVSWLIWRAPAQ